MFFQTSSKGVCLAHLYKYAAPVVAGSCPSLTDTQLLGGVNAAYQVPAFVFNNRRAAIRTRLRLQTPKNAIFRKKKGLQPLRYVLQQLLN